jgi:hypothetical protein
LWYVLCYNKEKEVSVLHTALYSRVFKEAQECEALLEEIRAENGKIENQFFEMLGDAEVAFVTNALYKTDRTLSIENVKKFFDEARENEVEVCSNGKEICFEDLKELPSAKDLRKMDLYYSCHVGELHFYPDNKDTFHLNCYPLMGFDGDFLGIISPNNATQRRIFFEDIIQSVKNKALTESVKKMLIKNNGNYFDFLK